MEITPEYLESLLLRSSPELSEDTRTLLARLRDERKFTGTPNVSDSTGSFLYHLVCDTGRKQILELGTANGYSTVYLAEALSVHALSSENGTSANHSAHILTIEIRRDDYLRARENLARYDKVLTTVRADASEFLQSATDLQVDLVFIDAKKSSTLEHFLLCRKYLLPGGIVVIDDVVKYGDERSHKMADFYEYLHENEIRYHVVMTDPDDGVMVIWG